MTRFGLLGAATVVLSSALAGPAVAQQVVLAIRAEDPMQNLLIVRSDEMDDSQS